MAQSMASAIRDYVSRGYGNKEAAEFLGCTADHVAIEKRKMKLKEKRPQGGKHKVAEIRTMLAEGRRIVDISLELGCCETTVHRHKRAMRAENEAS